MTKLNVRVSFVKCQEAEQKEKFFLTTLYNAIAKRLQASEGKHHDNCVRHTL